MDRGYLRHIADRWDDRYVITTTDGEVFERPVGFEIEFDDYGEETCTIDMGDTLHVRPLSMIASVKPMPIEG